MYVCKRCPAVGDDCAYCHGSGEVGDYYAPCFECGGAGVVAAAPKRFADLGDGGDA
jgi:DnaJ-class molecular chaperone